MAVAMPLSLCASKVNTASTRMAGDRIAEFVPQGYSPEFSPSLFLVKELETTGAVPSNWQIVPTFSTDSAMNVATIALKGDVSLYGGGEVTGPLLRNGQRVVFWNTDNPAYGTDNGVRLYQTHPWVMGVRPDGTTFGVIFDSFAKGDMVTLNDKIVMRSQGAPFRVYVIERETPQEMMRALAQLTGTISMPALWTLGYHQCRFSYYPEARVKEIADEFRKRQIPCDVIWFDIDYMDGFRIFTIDKEKFPSPERMNKYLHDNGFKSVYMIDPGVKVDPDYFVYQSGSKNNVWVRDAFRNEFHGVVWPGDCAFPDFTRPEVRQWWSGLYKPFLACGIDGIWNDMNEPAMFKEKVGTMPESNIHLGGGNLPSGNHRLYHNVYGRLMVEASYNGILAARPEKRPFILSRSNCLGGQRFAATWTGDNAATEGHMTVSIPMSVTLGLSGQPFNGPDIGGFNGNTSADLFVKWMCFGAFYPFSRGHTCEGTNNKEPWAFGKDVENECRMAISRRYRLIPYYYTLFRRAAQEGMPVMAPTFFADIKDKALRAEYQTFLIGDNLLVVPSIAENPNLPKGIWEPLSLVKGDTKGKFQAKLLVKGGSVIPVGKLVQNLSENPLEELTLVVVLDEKGCAAGELYWDAGDGWEFRNGDYSKVNFKATTENGVVKVALASKEGNRAIDLSKVKVELLAKGKVRRASGDLTKGITVK